MTGEQGVARCVAPAKKCVDQLVTWVAGVERGEPPKIADSVDSPHSTTATLTSSSPIDGVLGCHWALERIPLVGASKDTREGCGSFRDVQWFPLTLGTFFLSAADPVGALVSFDCFRGSRDDSSCP